MLKDLCSIYLLLIALPSLLVLFGPALVLAALVRPLVGIKPDDHQGIEELRKVCGYVWAIVLTALALLTE